MNERTLATLSGGGFVASVGLQHVAAGVSILAGLFGVAAAVPVIIDRYRHLLPDRITRLFPATRAPLSDDE
jgi:hypothetical protein